MTEERPVLGDPLLSATAADVAGPGLNEVFGVRTTVNSRSYVDRGGLDERLTYLLSADRHIAIHGDSKQGKSWLRSRVLRTDDTVVVQCQLGTTPLQLLVEALGALEIRSELKQTSLGTYEGSLEVSASTEVGAKIIAKLGLGGKATGKKSRTRGTETAPIGQTAGDLGWVAKMLSAAEKRIVIEDFHYVSEENRQECAFLFKALGDLGVYLLVIGIWPTDHLLPYYNGDLEGRVEDICLTWKPDELQEVLAVGCGQLGIAFSGSLRDALVADAYGNVGLLQRLAEAVCRDAGILVAQSDRPFLTPGEGLDKARELVADSMRGRYESFADNFTRGMRRLKSGLGVYKHILHAVCLADDGQLETGLDQAELLDRANRLADANIRPTDLTQALQRLEQLQAKIGIRPVVLTYSRAHQKLYVVDKSFLFFRKYGNPQWPWMDDDFSTENDLFGADPLDLDT